MAPRSPFIAGLALLLGLGACEAGEEPSAGEAPQRQNELPPLELPSIEGIDLQGAFTDGLRLIHSIDARPAWQGHLGALSLREAGCPDLYVGPPPRSRIQSTRGLSWSDECQSGDRTWSGWLHWDTTADAEGLPTDPGGMTWEASRSLEARARLREPDSALFELVGEASESVFRSTGEGYDTWTWSSRVVGTVTGDLAFSHDAALPDGFRADFYRYLQGGDTQRLQARGEAYFFQGRLHDRFDSLAMDLEMPGPGSVGPDDCPLEPRGWIGLRDTDAYWYDLVFLPRHRNDSTTEPYPNEPLSECDGCGTLYVRGVESGEVCLDFDFLFQESPSPPPLESFILTLHNLP